MSGVVVIYNYPEVLKLLIEAGASVDTQDKNGNSAFMAVAQRGHLDAQSADGSTSLFWASEANELEAMELLLKSGADPNHQDVNGSTAVMEAYIQRNFDVAIMLYRYGADPYIKDNDGLSALDYAKQVYQYDGKRARKKINVLFEVSDLPWVQCLLGIGMLL